jgi:histone arginine demethylase JMJD6
MENSNVSNKIIQKLKRLELTSDRFFKIEMSDKCKKIINKSKLKQRSDMKLEEWEKLKYSSDNWCEEMLKQVENSSIDIEDYDKLSENEFIEKYEKLNKPVIIRGVTKDWPADSNWTFEVYFI